MQTGFTTTGEKLRAFPFVQLRASVALVLMCGFVCGLLLLSSCGRVAPTYDPGTIKVTSTPEGAAIFFGGEDTGEITPFTFTELLAARYIIKVEMEGFFVSPDSAIINLTPAAFVTQNFDLSSDAPTQLVVTSDPAGAAIFLDGNDTGEVTPATLSDLEAGDVTVTLELAGSYVSPVDGHLVTIVAHETNELLKAFTVRSKKTVMMEGFSNVDCAGCPELATNVEALMHLDGYGLDKVLYCKFSMSWPGIDPHHLHNVPENNDRMNFYLSDLGGGIPMMEFEGIKATGTSANGTPTAGEIATMVDAALMDVPGFLIDITADFTSSIVPLTATLTAMEDVDLTGHTLYIALVQDFLEYEEAPGSEGETEFHWLFRDRVDTLPTLGNMTSGQTATFNETVNRGEWDLETLHVIAFVQNDATKTILQAGLSTTSAPAHAALFLDDNTLNRPTVEGNRP